MFSGLLFGAKHASEEANKTSGPLTDPISETIKKGDIVVAAVERFRLPQSRDANTGGELPMLMHVSSI